MYNYLKHFNHQVYVIATKIDRANQSERAKSNKNIKLKFDDPSLKLILTSSEKRTGFDQIYQIFENDLNE